ncbi:MAG: DUF4340 domain-containing protein [Pirellulaceae bacterium]
MSEMVKSLVFGGVAVGSLVLALVFGRDTPPPPVPEQIGESLFPKFTDPLQAKGLSIIRFDEAMAQIREIEVKNVNGIWTLPSHDGYPADAENRIRDATSPFVDLKIIQVVSDTEGEHSLYGVLEPNVQTTQASDEGVGVRVAIQDGSRNDLADLIIGKPVSGSEGQRYCREQGKPRVYICEVNPDNLPVRFDDWIKKDLLEVAAFDITQLVLKDYSFQVNQSFTGPVTNYDQRFEITMSEEAGAWTLDRLLENRNGDLVEGALLPSEELDKERLNGLRDALTEIQIVDVEKKPEGLTADLKADQGLFNNSDTMEETISSLSQRGIYPVQTGPSSDDIELLSSDGEVLARTREGVEYVLRFGRVRNVDTEGGEGKLNRYLLVSARVDMEQFPEPELEPLPELPAAENTDAQDADNASVDRLTTRLVALQDQDEAEQPAADDVSETVDEDANDAASEPQDAAADTSEQGATEEDTTTADDANESPEADATEDVDSNPADDTAAEVDAADASDVNPTAEATSQGSLEEIQAERERINKENQRKIDERNDKIAKAKDQVRQVNYRFADWYYVISEDVYKKIHLTKSDIIKVSEEAEKEGFGVDNFRELQERGLEKVPSPDPLP